MWDSREGYWDPADSPAGRRDPWDTIAEHRDLVWDSLERKDLKDKPAERRDRIARMDFVRVVAHRDHNFGLDYSDLGHRADTLVPVVPCLGRIHRVADFEDTRLDSLEH